MAEISFDRTSSISYAQAMAVTIIKYCVTILYVMTRIFAWFEQYILRYAYLRMVGTSFRWEDYHTDNCTWKQVVLRALLLHLWDSIMAAPHPPAITTIVKDTMSCGWIRIINKHAESWRGRISWRILARTKKNLAPSARQIWVTYLNINRHTKRLGDLLPPTLSLRFWRLALTPRIHGEKIQSPFLQYFHKYYDTTRLKLCIQYYCKNKDNFELRIYQTYFI